MNEEYKVIIDHKYFENIEEYFCYWRFKYNYLAKEQIDEYYEDDSIFRYFLNKKTNEFIVGSDSFEKSYNESLRILNLLKISFIESK